MTKQPPRRRIVDLSRLPGGTDFTDHQGSILADTCYLCGEMPRAYLGCYRPPQPPAVRRGHDSLYFYGLCVWCAAKPDAVTLIERRLSAAWN